MHDSVQLILILLDVGVDLVEGSLCLWLLSNSDIFVFELVGSMTKLPTNIHSIIVVNKGY